MSQNFVESINTLMGTNYKLDVYGDISNPYFSLKQACDILHMKVSTGKGKVNKCDQKIIKRRITINESGILTLIITSKSETATFFKKFIIHLIKKLATVGYVNNNDVAKFKSENKKLLQKIYAQNKSIDAHVVYSAHLQAENEELAEAKNDLTERLFSLRSMYVNIKNDYENLQQIPDSETAEYQLMHLRAKLMHPIYVYIVNSNIICNSNIDYNYEEFDIYNKPHDCDKYFYTFRLKKENMLDANLTKVVYARKLKHRIMFKKSLEKTKKRGIYYTSLEEIENLLFNL